MRVENRYERARTYVDALLAEIGFIAQRLGGRGRLMHIHFGGGTPNFLHQEDLGHIVDAIEIGFGLTDETPMAMEIDPRLYQQTDYQELAACGVNRVSLGVQDFDSDVQQAINRIQPFDMVEGCVSDLRSAGIDDISFDLLYGLPKQTLCRFKDTIHKTLSLAPDRVSLFGYAHMPDRLPHQRMIPDADLPSRSLRVALAELADAELVANGYMPVGFDHYARPHTALAAAARRGKLNRNFQGYTEDPARTVIGFGASAITSMPGLHVQNHKDVADYQRAVLRHGIAASRGVHAMPADVRLGDWITRLLCDKRASLAQYLDIAAPTAEELGSISQAIEQLIADDVVTVEGNELLVLEHARSLLRSVAAVFDPAVTAKTRFASPAI